MDLTDEKFKDKLENFRKTFIIVSMLIVGLLLSAYKLNVNYWDGRFGSYTSMVLGITALLLVVAFILMFIDIKRFFRFELMGFIIAIVAAVVLAIYPAAPVLGMSVEGGSVVGIIGAGIALIVVAGIFLARSGGYFGPVIIGLGFQIIYSGYYPMMNPDATSFHSNAFIASNIGIGFLVMSFILMIYHDLKFYYLANLIKNANRLRKEKKYDEALKFCDKALFIYPNFVTALNNKGNILFNLKKPKEAVEYYTKAININPNYKQAHSNLEVVERKLGRAA